MKLLAKLQKTKIVWWLIALCMFVFFLRLPSVIEPYWYGDEGIYEVIGLAMDHGRLLYRDIWDNKPPLLYVVYALAQGDQPTVKIFSLLAGLLSLIAFFFLAQKLFHKPRISIAITACYAILFGTPLLEGNIANAEDFILLPIILAGLLIFKFADLSSNKTNKSKKSSLFIAGLLLGIAFLFKIVAIFDLAAFMLYFIIINFPTSNFPFPFRRNHLKVESRKSKGDAKWQMVNIKPLLNTSCFLLLGFLLPFLITVIYFASNHALQDFIQAAFSGNVNYVAWQNTFLGIPQGLLLLKGILLVISVSIIFWKRNRFTKPALFVTLWLVFALFDAYFSGRPYTHYAIVILPSFCFFIGLFLASRKTWYRLLSLLILLLIIVALNFQFHFNAQKSYTYYQNAIQFISGQKSVTDYQSFFDPKVPRDYALALFIRNHTKPSDTVFIWGNSPQIYTLSHKLPPGKYTVAYHITQNNAQEQTQQIINSTLPKYVIVLKESQPLPFSLPLYIMRYSIPGAIIYERSL